MYILCRSLFVPLSRFFWSLCCLSFDLRILLTPLVSSNSAYTNTTTRIKYKICHIQLSAPDAPQNVTGDVVISPANDNSSSCLVNVSWSPPLYTDSNNEVSSYVIKWYKVIPIHLSKFIEPHQMLEDVSGVCIWLIWRWLIKWLNEWVSELVSFFWCALYRSGVWHIT
jgi:hypothetical protein